MNKLHCGSKRGPRSPGDHSWQLSINPDSVTFGPHGRDSPDGKSIAHASLSKTALAEKAILHTSAYRSAYLGPWQSVSDARIRKEDSLVIHQASVQTPT